MTQKRTYFAFMIYDFISNVAPMKATILYDLNILYSE